MLKIIVVSLIGTVVMAGGAVAAQKSFKGSAEVSNDGCPLLSQSEQSDHIILTITGAAAKRLRDTLKAKVGLDEALTELGLDFYVSKDGILSCAADGKSCSIGLGAPSASLEPVQLCD
jgi:hypothetical protein